MSGNDTRNKTRLINLIFNEVKKTPKGKVTTYGGIAAQINKLSDLKNGHRIHPRYVGHILHNNTEPGQIPCHRVVNAKGLVADNYKFGGWREQKKVLIAEGVEFVKEKKVNIKEFKK